MNDTLFQRELEISKNVIEKLKNTKNLELLLPNVTNRLPIFSFLIKVPDTKIYLHHNFISSILNDVFGIQVRGGCVCAGPYAQAGFQTVGSDWMKGQFLKPKKAFTRNGYKSHKSF